MSKQRYETCNSRVECWSYKVNEIIKTLKEYAACVGVKGWYFPQQSMASRNEALWCKQNLSLILRPVKPTSERKACKFPNKFLPNSNNFSLCAAPTTSIPTSCKTMLPCCSLCRANARQLGSLIVALLKDSLRLERIARFISCS